MTPPENSIAVGLCGVLTVLAVAYACGRLQQWYRQGAEREDAFKRGYDLASQSLFHIATRAPSTITRAAGEPARATASLPGRHATVATDPAPRTRDLRKHYRGPSPVAGADEPEIARRHNSRPVSRLDVS